MKSIVLILVTIFFIRCENSFTNKNKSKLPNPPRNLVTYYFWIGCGSSMKLIADTFLEDQKNGTYLVKRNSGYTYSAPGCTGLSSVTTENLYYIKKCLQGQVYRTAENDCKGTGNVTNSWGAQKFQWCSAIDDSCLNSSKDGYDKIKSPAGASCTNDSLLNKSWGLFGTAGDIYYRVWKIPDETEAFPIWGSAITTIQKNKAETLTPSANTIVLKESSALLTDFNNVVCVAKL